MITEDYIKELKRKFDKHDKAIEELDRQIDEFIDFIGIKTDLIVFFEYYYGIEVIEEGVLLQYDGNKDQFVWDYDWDEGQEFKLKGFTPLDEVEPKYILEGDKFVKAKKIPSSR